MLKVLRLVLVAVVAGCGSSPPESAELPSQAPAESEAARKPMLPAHPLPGERQGAKADQFDDFRLDNTSVYGITTAPKTPMRAVGQYDDHQRLLLPWTGNFANTVAGIVAAAKPRIDIYVLHEGQISRQQFLNAMAQYGVSTTGIQFVNVNLDSIWVRDYGPLSVRTPSGEVAFVDPRYYHQRVYDDAIPTLLGNAWGLNVYRQPLSWEGGTYITDGHGNCYYSQGVLWYGGTTQSKIEQYQKDYLGCETNIVLKPLIEEGTTHSDMFAKLTGKNSMVLGDYETWQDAGNAAAMNDNEAIIEAAILTDGSKVTVTRIPMPSNSNRQVWRTYANSLFVNGVNLVPVYEDDTTFEAEALAVWEAVMPDWEHVPIDSTDLITWAGAIHCITMTVPDGALTEAESDPSFLCQGDFDCHPNDTGAGSCSLSYEGCCDGTSVQLCGASGPQSQPCGGAGCGWSDATNAYACGGFGAGPDNAPLQCGVACVPSCAGKDCGADGCGGSCGSCGAGQTCNGGQCQDSGDPCGGITYEGCCDGGTLKYCDNGVQTQSCNGGACGWSSGQGWYDCGFSGSDPTGEHPKACPAECTPSCEGQECGSDGCGGSCGSCGAGQTCTAGQCLCQPSCSGKACGPDGCGGSCGSCGAGQTCSPQGQCVGQCTPNCAGKACGPDGCGGSCGVCQTGESCTAAGQCQAAQGCGDVDFNGFCTGSVLTWCNDGELATYDCKGLGNFECGAIPGSAPPNHDCLELEGCTANCAGKECGGDGCGGVCGTCEPGAICQSGQCVDESDPCEGLTFDGCCDGNVLNWCENNQKQTLNCGGAGCGWNDGAEYYDCNHSGDGPPAFPKDCGGAACVPNCAGNVCGSDGCGGSCGVCTGGSTCQSGQCVDPCGGVAYEGECDGAVLSYCEDGEVSAANCTQFGGCCGWDAGGTYFNCLEGAACQGCTDECQSGQAGCSVQGTHAWTCQTEGDDCNRRIYTPCQSGACNPATGQCPSACVPSCTGKSCGSDGCGGSCGACGAGESCNAAGQCGACAPSCDGKSCGSDGCGGSCGTCAQGLGCVSGKCVPTTCTPKCEGKLCGDDSCGGSCGACETGLICDKTGQCIDPPACEPDCEGKLCGPDGCGGNCGVCSKDSSCKDGQCEPNPNAGCRGVPTAGVCQGEVLRFCDETGSISEINCAAQGLACGDTGIGFDCVDPSACVPQCAGKQCGSDSCGGSCGSCSKGDACAGGTCVSDTCLPKCQGKACGPDGCGGSCGSCASGTCTDAGVCEDESTDGTDGVLDGTDASDDAASGEEDTSGGCACDVTGPRTPAQSTGGAALALLFFGLWLTLRTSSVRPR